MKTRRSQTEKGWQPQVREFIEARPPRDIRKQKQPDRCDCGGRITLQGYCPECENFE